MPEQLAVLGRVQGEDLARVERDREQASIRVCGGGGVEGAEILGPELLARLVVERLEHRDLVDDVERVLDEDWRELPQLVRSLVPQLVKRRTDVFGGEVAGALGVEPVFGPVDGLRRLWLVLRLVV